MCEPATIALAVTAVAGAYSAHQSNEQGKYQQAVAERNADMQANQATDARARGVVAGEEQRDRARRLGARQATELAGSGLDISSGTSLDLFAETATLGEYDAQVVENNAARGAYGFNFRSENSRLSGRNARSAGRNQAIGTLLTTGANAASMGMGGGSAGGGAGTFGGGSPGNLYG